MDRFSATVALFVLLLLGPIHVSAAESKQTQLYRDILAADALLFEQGFNQCDMAALREMAHPDFEFYHDQSGTTFGKESFVAGIEQNICSLDYRPRRVLVEGSVDVYPLRSNGKLYGAIQTGTHEFLALRPAQPPERTSVAKFTHLWIKNEDRWMLKRVLSFDHQPPGGAQQLPPAVDFSSSSSVEAWLHENKVPALGIAVIKDFKLESLAVYGELQRGESAPIDAVFNVASLAKPVVSMLTLKLVEQGRWDLDEPLARYWVDPDVSADPYHELLTTRHVLSHQTGFDNWRHVSDGGKLSFKFRPGSGFGYSGEGFEYLRNALEARFDKTLDQLAQELIFRPLKMSDTDFVWRSSMDESRFALWHDSDGTNSYPMQRNTRANAADDLLTTVEDYGRFAEFVIRGGDLSASLFREMVTRQNGAEYSVKMGLGWEILPDLSEAQFALLHTGGDMGVNTLVVLLPETGEGLIVFTNGDNGKNLYFPLIRHYLSLGAVIAGA